MSAPAPVVTTLDRNVLDALIRVYRAESRDESEPHPTRLAAWYRLDALQWVREFVDADRLHVQPPAPSDEEVGAALGVHDAPTALLERMGRALYGAAWSEVGPALARGRLPAPELAPAEGRLALVGPVDALAHAAPQVARTTAQRAVVQNAAEALDEAAERLRWHAEGLRVVVEEGGSCG